MRGYPLTNQLNTEVNNNLVLSWEEIKETVKERKKKMQTYEQHIKEFRDKAIRQATAGKGNFNNYIYGNIRNGSRFVGTRKKRKAIKKGK